MATESDVLSEIEVLQSIYLDDLRITQRDDEGWEVSLVLYPSTGEDSLSQFVRLTLTLVLNSQYPSTPPTISIHNPRGLSDDKLLSVERCLQMEAESCVGMPVLYQLIERAKEILTESNIPHGNCVICLYGFKEGEVFTKTSCYHYFHSHCLGRYITHSERELREREKEMEEDKTREWAEELNVVCPVCREALTYDVNVLLSSPPPSFPKLKDGVIGAEFRQKWAELQRVLDRQREKGGIIDPEAESKRFLIHINEPQPDTSDVPETELDASQTLPCPPPNSASQIPVSQSQHVSGRSQYRAGYGRSQHGGFKGGRKGRGRQVPFEKTRPVTDNLAKLDLSSDKCQEVKNLSVGQEHAETESSPEGDALESKLGQAGTDGEQPINIRHLETSMSTDGQQTKQSKTAISKTGGQTDSMREKPSRDRPDRGQRRDPRGSGQPRQFQERNFCGSYHWDSSGGVYNHRGGRGHRVRGGRPGYSHFRGSGAHRGGGRGFHQKVEGEVERGLL